MARKVAVIAGASGAGLGVLSAAGSIGAACYFARVLLTPERERPDNVDIAAVDIDAATITLELTEESVVPGRFGLWTHGGLGHLRVGDILDVDPDAGQVTRTLDAVDSGEPAPGPSRWDASYWPTRPDQCLDLPTEEVFVPGELGDMPAWLVPADPAAPAQGEGRWAVLVHGRGATRLECLRAVAPLHRLGLTCLIPTYRNDVEGPPSPDGLYNLGLSEWRDTEAALRYALAHGARDITLVGWSMGGAIILQTLDLSPLAAHVGRVVLDSPVIDWGDVIDHHARLRHVPPALAVLVEALIGARRGHRLAGVHEPLDVARTNWQDRSADLRHRMLLLHSADDEFVPVGPSRELARRRPDLVTYEEWTRARHVQEWNTDPERWERVVTDFLR